MRKFPFIASSKSKSEKFGKIADELRRLAYELEQGEIEQVVVTVIRHGKAERLSNASPVAMMP